MFVDKVAVIVKAGDGGNGIVRFRHEKFIDKGGPDGGDGGRGGDVILVASRNQNTLAAFRYKKAIEAEAGELGDKRKRNGKSAHDLRGLVPVGTAAINEAGETVADLTSDGQEVIIAKGGRGGFGNAHFISSCSQAPRVAEKGDKGDKLATHLELQMIYDAVVVGRPNAAKEARRTTRVRRTSGRPRRRRRAQGREVRPSGRSAKPDRANTRVRPRARRAGPGR